MKHHRPLMLLLTVVLSFTCVAVAVAKPRSAKRLIAGTWAGPHININATADAASIEYDCAHGAINGPLTLNSRGEFRWRGSHGREHGGPIRIDETRAEAAALYIGKVKGDTMTLTVKLADSGETIGTFVVKRNGRGRVFKCM